MFGASVRQDGPDRDQQKLGLLGLVLGGRGRPAQPTWRLLLFLFGYDLFCFLGSIICYPEGSYLESPGAKRTDCSADMQAAVQ